MKTTFKTTVLALLLACCMMLFCGISAFAADPDTSLPVRVVTLNGTTGFGMAGLIAAHEAGETALNYSFTVDTDASNVTAALVSGDCDIAALPTNAASALYNKTAGKVQVLALNTRGVLYLVSDGSVKVDSMADLDGQTVYAPAQNPSFIFAALCSKNGIELNIDTSYAQPAELNTAVAAGEVSLAVPPEPMVTVARSQNQDLVVALDLTAEWDKVFEPGSLVQGCVVVRTEFASEHPAEVAAFLEDYGKSVALLTDDVPAAAKAIEEAGIFAKAAVAEKAIPKCNVCFVTGEEMQEELGAFLDLRKTYGLRLICIHDGIDTSGEFFPDTSAVDILDAIGILPAETVSVRRSSARVLRLRKDQVVTPKTKLRQDKEKMIVNMYKAGHQVEDIWKVSGYKSRTSVFRVLRRAGVEPNRKPTSGSRHESDEQE